MSTTNAYSNASFAWSFQGKTHHDAPFEITHASGIPAALRSGLKLPDALIVQGPVTIEIIDAIVKKLDTDFTEKSKTDKEAKMNDHWKGLAIITGATGTNGKECGQEKLEEFRKAVRKYGGRVVDIEAVEARKVRFYSDLKGRIGRRVHEIVAEQNLSAFAGSARIKKTGRRSPKGLIVRINTANLQTIYEAIEATGTKLTMEYFAAAMSEADRYVAFVEKNGHMKEDGDKLEVQVRNAWKAIADVVSSESICDDGALRKELTGLLDAEDRGFKAALRRTMVLRFAMVMAMCKTTDLYVDGEGFGVTSAERGTPGSCVRFVKPEALENMRAFMLGSDKRFKLAPAYDPYTHCRAIEEILGLERQSPEYYMNLIHHILTSPEPKPIDLSTPEGRKRLIWFLTDPWEECDDTVSFVMSVLAYAGCDLKFFCLDGERNAQERALQLFKYCPRI